MIYFIQLLKMIKKNEGKDRAIEFVALFEDLSFELEEMGYKDCPEDLIGTMLFNHFGLSLDCPEQLTSLTEYILKHQNDLQYTNILVQA